MQKLMEFSMAMSIETFIVRNLNHVVNPNEGSPQSLCKRVRDYALLVGMPVLAVVTKFPFFSISNALVPQVPNFHYVLSTCNLAAFSTLIWASTRQVLGNFVKEADPLLRDVSGNQITPLHEKILATAGIATGLVAQTPLGFLVYKYNGKNLFFAVALVLGDPWVPGSSALNFYRWSLGKFLIPKNSDADRTKQLFLSRFDTLRSAILKKTQEEQLSFLHEVKPLLDNKDNSAALLSVLEVMDERVGSEKAIETVGSNACFTTALKVIGSVLLLSQFAIVASATIEGARLIDKSDEVVYGVATIVLMAYAQVLGSSIMQGTVNSGVAALDYVTGQGELTPMQMLYPIQSGALRIGLIALCALAWGPNVQIADSNFQGLEKEILQVTSALGVFALTTAFVIPTVEGGIWDILASKKHTPAHTAKKVEDFFNAFTYSVNAASNENWMKFYSKLPSYLKESEYGVELPISDGYRQLGDGSAVSFV